MVEHTALSRECEKLLLNHRSLKISHHIVVIILVIFFATLTAVCREVFLSAGLVNLFWDISEKS